MRASLLRSFAAALALALAACGSGEIAPSGPTGNASGGAGGSGGGSGGSPDAGAPDAGKIDKAEPCADTFGTELTNAYGRIDGTVLAVVKPTDTQCALPNDDHVILQVTMNGAAYRMVINVESSFGDPQVGFLSVDHSLPAPVWAEGWHPGVALDYVSLFGVHTDSFTPYPLTELSDVIADAITLGQKVSVYATSSGGASAHKVHRNEGKTDGAIVLDPDGAEPRALLFRFANQVF